MVTPQAQTLLIVSRNTLHEARENTTVFRHLAGLSRRGWHLLLTASEPDQWFPTRKNEDNVLTAQAQLQALIQEFGGDIDGVYYVPRSELTQDRNREGALQDIMTRYTQKPENTHLVSSSRRFLLVAKKTGMHTHSMAKGEPGVSMLADCLEQLADSV